MEGILTLKRIGNKLFNEQTNVLRENPAPIPDESDEDESTAEKNIEKQGEAISGQIRIRKLLSHIVL